MQDKINLKTDYSTIPLPFAIGRDCFTPKATLKTQDFRTHFMRQLNPKAKHGANVRFMKLFKEVLTEKRKWYEFTDDGKVIDVSAAQFQRRGIKTALGSSRTPFAMNTRQSDLCVGSEFETNKVKQLPKYIQAFKLPIFDRKFQVVSLKGFMKSRQHKQTTSLVNIEAGPATYDSLRKACGSQLNLKQPITDNNDMVNLKGKKYLLKNKEENGEVSTKFRRSNAGPIAEIFYARYEKEKKASIPIYDTKSFIQQTKQ